MHVHLTRRRFIRFFRGSGVSIPQRARMWQLLRQGFMWQEVAAQMGFSIRPGCECCGNWYLQLPRNSYEDCNLPYCS